MKKEKIDSTRASKAGHQFHEAWVTRSALKLLEPNTLLYKIAVEGPDYQVVDSNDHEKYHIVDATYYYKCSHELITNEKREYIQFKYSFANSDKNFTVSDAREIIKKFADLEKSFLTNQRKAHELKGTSYVIFTNQSLSPELKNVLEVLKKSNQKQTIGGSSKASTLQKSIGLEGIQLVNFAKKIRIIENVGTLQDIEDENRKIISNWFLSDSVNTNAKLGELKTLIQKKAGINGSLENTIIMQDVYYALGIEDEQQLFPAPSRIQESKYPIKREQLKDFLNELRTDQRWVIHAKGGIGKTQFALDLASELRKTDEVILFDCYGGGLNNVDQRYLSHNGLLQIVNELSIRGLCDKILPNDRDDFKFIRDSLKSFETAIKTMRVKQQNARLFLIIDAADNAAITASSTQSNSFPKDLMEYLSVNENMIDGLYCIYTSRSDRIEDAVGFSKFSQFKLNKFSLLESSEFISKIKPNASKTEIQKLHSFASGNPYTMNLYLNSWSLEKINLDIRDNPNQEGLIKHIFEESVTKAKRKIGGKETVDKLLRVLSILPPPIPYETIAYALNSHFRSLSVDDIVTYLAPLIGNFKSRIVFENELVETQIRKSYPANRILIQEVIKNLKLYQNSSTYIKRILPNLLLTLNEYEELYSLATENQVSEFNDSNVFTKSELRIETLRTALKAALKESNYEMIVKLSIELVLHTFSEARNVYYIENHPDLVSIGKIASIDHTQFAQSAWWNSGYSPLIILSCIDGEPSEAARYVESILGRWEWLKKQPTEIRKNNPRRLIDCSAVAFYFLVTEQFDELIVFLNWFKPEWVYIVAKKLLDYCIAVDKGGKSMPVNDNLTQLLKRDDIPSAFINAVYTKLPEIISYRDQSGILRKVNNNLNETSIYSRNNYILRCENNFFESLLHSAIRMTKFGLLNEAKIMLSRTGAPEKIRLSSFDLQFFDYSHCHSYSSVALIFGNAIETICNSREVSLFDCLPHELSELIESEPEFNTINLKLDTIIKIFEKWKLQSLDSKSKLAPELYSLLNSTSNQVIDYIVTDVYPIFDLTKIVQNILKCNDFEKTQQHIEILLNSWLSIDEKKSERESYLAKLHEICVVELFVALNQISPNNAKLLSSCITNRTTISTKSIICFVQILSNCKDCDSECIKLAEFAVGKINSTVSIRDQSLMFAELARACVSADIQMATKYLGFGLKVTDKLRNKDEYFLNQILIFAEKYNNKTPNPKLARQLINIFESNVHGWTIPLISKAIASISKIHGIAQFTQWHDKNFMDFGYTLPDNIIYNLKCNMISIPVFISILRTIKPEFINDDHWIKIFKEFNKKAEQDKFILELIDIIESEIPSSISLRRSHGFTEYLDLLATDSENTKNQINLLKLKLAKVSEISIKELFGDFDGYVDSSSDKSQENELIENALSQLTPFNQDSLENFVEQKANYAYWYSFIIKVLKQVGKIIPNASQKSFLDIILTSQRLNLEHKIAILTEILEDCEQLNSRETLLASNYSNKLIEAHFNELIHTHSNFKQIIQDLANILNTSTHILAKEFTKIICEKKIHVSTHIWLALATIFSSNVKSNNLTDSIKRLFDGISTESIEEFDIESSYNKFDPKSEEIETCAGYLWSQLGSVDIEQRWRAAHSVRLLAKFEKWDTIRILFNKYESENAGEFQDPDSKFNYLNARLWFLIAIARIALSNSEKIY